MRWDEDDLKMGVPVKGYRPRVEVAVGPDRRFRHPAAQAIIDRRVAIYATQVEEQGFITWLPRKGSGQ